MKYDSMIIGAGIAGIVAARELAEQGGKKVLVIEKRDHIGGNCYDVKDSFGILIHQYGPHIFHTNSQRVYEYLSRFTQWYHFHHEVAAKVNDRLIPVPFNLNTLHLVYDQQKAERLEKKLIEIYGMESRVPILKLRENTDPDIQGIADYVYENIFLHYTMKQWGQKPEEIDPAVTGRVPIVITRDNGYFQDTYQGLPLLGYTRMFEQLLDHPGITVKLKTDAKDCLQITADGVLVNEEVFTGDIIYTGPLDELFSCEFGRLPYRTLDFVFEHKEEEFFQEYGVVNYTVSEDYTRITEFKYLTGQQAKGSTIVKEYPKSYTGALGEIPYYAIQNAKNKELYQKYTAKIQQLENFHLLGRLAEYKYYNMDAMVDSALRLSERLLKKA